MYYFSTEPLLGNIFKFGLKDALRDTNLQILVLFFSNYA